MRLEKRQRREDDREIMELIRRTEAEGLIRAPGHMKEEILKHSDRIDYRLSVQARKFSQKTEFYLYSAKVAMAVVAALVMIVMVPADMTRTGREPEKTAQQTIGSRMNEGMQMLEKMFRETMNEMKENDGGFLR